MENKELEEKMVNLFLNGYGLDGHPSAGPAGDSGAARGRVYKFGQIH
jgi:hypothetical protein